MTPLERAVHDHLFALEVKGYSLRTIEGRRYSLNQFHLWALPLGIEEPREVTRRVLVAYQKALFRRRKPNGQPISFRTQARHVNALKQLFRWLAKEDRVDANPAADLELPREPHRLPRDVFNEEEVERVLAVPNVDTLQGLRDRAIMELLYATGLRRGEVANLDIRDLDLSRSRLLVREGKGRRDRVVPVSKRAMAWILKYVDERGPSADGAVFLNVDGDRLGLRYYTGLIGGYVEKSGVAKQGACHIFRHTMATLMLENGADIRFVQEMLGHAQLSTTQIYTRVSIRKLQEIYDVTHPSAAVALDSDSE